MTDVKQVSSSESKCRHYYWSNVRQDISADVQRYISFSSIYQQQRSSWRAKLSCLMMPTMMAIVIYRLAHFLHCRDWSITANILCKINTFLFKVQIPQHSCIEGGLYIPHPVSIVFIGSAGVNLSLYAGSCCFNYDSNQHIGDNVSLGAVATVINSSIGDNTQVSFGVTLDNTTIPANKQVISKRRLQTK